MRRIKELDGLRAIAILAVLGCHFQGFAERLGGITEFGWAGVDVFFALSGYLITNILLGLRSAETPYKTFYSRRMIRILPPYIAAMVVIILFNIADGSYFVLAPSFLSKQVFFLQSFTVAQFHLLHTLVFSPLWSLRHFSSLLANAHHLPLGRAGMPPDFTGPLGVFWSLSVEEYFYIVWAPIVLHFSRRSLTVLAVLICPVEMILRWFCNSDSSYFGIFFRFDALLYGALLALLFDYWKRRNLQKWSPTTFKAIFALSIAGLIAILVAIRPVLGREIRSSLLFEVFGLALISIATTSLIGVLLLKADSSWWFSRLLRTPGMQLLGTISYTLYLVHSLVYVIVAHVFAKVHLTLSSVALKMVIAVLSSILAIMVAKLSWHYFEYPLLRWKDKRFPSNRTAVAAPMGSQGFDEVSREQAMSRVD